MGPRPCKESLLSITHFSCTKKNLFEEHKSWWQYLLVQKDGKEISEVKGEELEADKNEKKNRQGNKGKKKKEEEVRKQIMKDKR